MSGRGNAAAARLHRGGQALARLLAPERTEPANRDLGIVLAFVAGAANTIGFLHFHHYTSHLTGVLSNVADDVSAGLWRAALAGAGLLVVFLAGAATTAVLVNWGKRHDRHSVYGLPPFLEALLLLAVAALCAQPSAAAWRPAMAAGLLTFVMGLQNALITKVANAVIRTTHVTGIVTDLGIELGKLMYVHRTEHPDPALRVHARRDRILLLSSLLAAFFGGGVGGGLGYRSVGALALVPLAVLLTGLALPHVLLDLRGHEPG